MTAFPQLYPHISVPLLGHDPSCSPYTDRAGVFVGVHCGVLAIISPIILSTNSGSPKSHKLPD